MKKNALIILDFVDAYHSGLSTLVEKCVQCFTVIFQNSASKNYTEKTMHIVACLKKIWKPQFRYVVADNYFADLIFNS